MSDTARDRNDMRMALQARFQGDPGVDDIRAGYGDNHLPADDLVSSPPHYLMHPSGVEAITITEAFNFNLGNVIKYVWRAGLKGGADQKLEDLGKSLWYLERELERLRRG